MIHDLTYLLNRIAYARDEQAYRSVFLHFHPGLYRLCYGLVKNREAAEEIVSDVLLKVWTMEASLNYVEDIQAYLYKAVRNKSLTWVTRQKERWKDIDEALPADIGTTAENLYINTETGLEIESAISTLPPQCQLVFRLVKEEGLSHHQVKSILEISQNTIEAHMRTALKRIRLQLETYLAGKK